MWPCEALPRGLVGGEKVTMRAWVVVSCPMQVTPTASVTKRGLPGLEASQPRSVRGLLCERTPLPQGPQGIGFISTCRDSPSEVSVAPSNQLSLQNALNTDCLRKTAPQN